MKHRKANLFLVGAMKAGTTALVDFLDQLEEVYVPPIKEPHYFVDELPKTLYEPSRFFSLEDYFDNEFPNPLHITKIETANQYEKAYSLAGGETYLLDASTAYLHCKETPQLIKEYAPDAKILMILRDPLKRAFSHYGMNVGKGRTLKSFEEVLKDDIENYENGTLQWHSYLGMSLYTESIERYKGLFDEVCVLNFEALIGNDEKEIEKLLRFLSIDKKNSLHFGSKNQARTGKFPKLFYFLKKIGLKDFFSKLFGSKTKQWIFRKVSSAKKPDMELSEPLRHKAQEIFNKESRI